MQNNGANLLEDFWTTHLFTDELKYLPTYPSSLSTLHLHEETHGAPHIRSHWTAHILIMTQDGVSHVAAMHMCQALHCPPTDDTLRLINRSQNQISHPGTRVTHQESGYIAWPALAHSNNSHFGFDWSRFTLIWNPTEAPSKDGVFQQPIQPGSDWKGSTYHKDENQVRPQGFYKQINLTLNWDKAPCLTVSE